ncbi:hypothetical protein [Flavobacterium silvaticum]|uniref:Uncharacterized protein n=1 Tax=Flavobacterium silvaticum TaxID=1852020 RepID=A0A972FJG8_9FLAO|nr:hypothetical protein [Flavobacterium silvaticum]NMH26913.1 hypothetical protein [Flavobacterium silvaticum]
MIRFIFFLLLPVTLFAQKTKEQIISQLNENVKKFAGDPDFGQIVLSQTDLLLKIGYRIPVLKTTAGFDNTPFTISTGAVMSGKVFFECPMNCIKRGTAEVSRVNIAFKEKDGAEEFVRLVGELREVL